MQSPAIEEWRPIPIPEYAEIYEVSNHGRVRRSSPHIGKGRNNPVGFIMKPKPTQAGHLIVTLSANGNQPKFLVHRLVLMAFIGPPPDGMEGCHEDGNPTNNHLPNLRWDTRRNNIKDTRRHGRLNEGERNGAHKLTIDQIP